MKKLLGIVLTLLLLISLMACAAKENVDTQVPDEQQVPAEDASVPAETEFLILERPDDAIESLEWAKEQTWDKKYTVGFANLVEDSEDMLLMRDYMVECCEAYGMEVSCVNNNFDGATALSNAEVLLQKGIDGLIEFNVDESVGGVIMEKCNEAGVPVIAIDIPHPGATFFGADNEKCGFIAGEALANQAVEKWNGEVDCLLLIDHMDSGELPRQRILKAPDGVRSVIPDFPEDRVFIVDGGGHDVTDCQSAVASFLAAHPDWDNILICGLQTTDGIGALAAIEMADRVDDCIMIINNENDFFAHVKNYPDEESSPWYGCVTFMIRYYGQWVAPAMREILDTGVMPETVYVDHDILTRDNIDEMFPTWKEDY